MKNESIKKTLFNNKKTIFLLIVAILIQTILFVIVGMNKTYFHEDEIYSYSLATKKEDTDIYRMEDFFNNWHAPDYYEDYMRLNGDEILSFKSVYENQKHDVHPPFYYLIIRIVMQFIPNSYSKWIGITINIIIYIFITIISYFILAKLFEGSYNYKDKSVLIALTSSITLASLSCVIFIRMYALLSLIVLMSSYFHIKLYEQYSIKSIIIISIISIIGFLTHYYFVIFCSIISVITIIKYMKNKEYKRILSYILGLLIAVVAFINIFPESFFHVLYSYRGIETINNLVSLPELVKNLKNIGDYLKFVYIYIFNKSLLLFIAFAIISKRRNKITINKNSIILLISSIIYIVVVSILSEYREIRYIMPINSLLFITVFYLLYQKIESSYGSKRAFIYAIVICLITIITPIVLRISPLFVYEEKKETIEQVETEHELPALYVLKLSDNRFIADILLFTKIDYSCIINEIDCNKEYIKNIFRNKDTSNGVILFVDDQLKKDSIVNNIKEYLNLSNVTYIKKLERCSIFILK